MLLYGISTKTNNILNNIACNMSEQGNQEHFSNREDISLQREWLRKSFLLKTVLSETERSVLKFQPSHEKHPISLPSTKWETTLLTTSQAAKNTSFMT
jgi:hypothetical protein